MNTEVKTEKEFQKTNLSEQKLCYILDEDEAWAKETFSPLQTIFNFQLQFFGTLFTLTSELLKIKNAIVIINMDAVINLSDDEMKELRDKYLRDKSVIFISRSSAFNFRLRAVQLNGRAFLVKPFLLSEITTELNRILSIENTNYKVLIVDDDPDSANYFTTILNAVGIETLVVSLPHEVDQALHQFKSDVILMDYYMPECSGNEMVSIIRQQRMYENIPIIFLSSEEDKRKQLEAMAFGADDFLSKNIDPEYLILTVINKANRYKQLSQLINEDRLTGLPSTSDVLDKLHAAVIEAGRQKTTVSAAIINIDKFKTINTTYGAAAGDQVLKTLTTLITKRLQPQDFLGRYGDGQILVVFPSSQSDVATNTINEWRTLFQSISYWWDYRMFNATFRASVADFPSHPTSAELLHALDEGIRAIKPNTVEGA